ncbi:permease [Cellulomonas cellasea DSM 20118]|uniref:Permease n=2 Tax=Cellulomonas cellasea TaxID=43670 RepID=A0A0A0BCZ5_9CELL|nr:permease [Cellulomonas cellasea DSM 20118]
MGSTHYMGLLADNQPWNLLLFMAVPVVLAETIAVTELAILFRRDVPRVVADLNRYAGLVAGFYFVGVVVYLTKHAVIPLTTSGGWRGWVDVVAVGFYLLGVVPLLGMSLLETRAVGAGWDDRRRLQVHATLVGLFLVVAHVAMIAGMLDPGVVAGWEPTHVMHDGSSMVGMTH